jgi:hypothetical protein
MSTEFLTLGQAARKIPTASGRPMSTQNLYRWTQSGCKGVILPSLRFGRRIVIKEADLEQFARDLALAYAQERQESPTRRAPSKKRTRTPEERARAVQEAEDSLRAHGVLTD